VCVCVCVWLVGHSWSFTLRSQTGSIMFNCKT